MFDRKRPWPRRHLVRGTLVLAMTAAGSSLASAETALNPRRSLLHANLVRLAAQDVPLESITL